MKQVKYRQSEQCDAAQRMLTLTFPGKIAFEEVLLGDLPCPFVSASDERLLFRSVGNWY
jgi:hypothetical protein